VIDPRSRPAASPEASDRGIRRSWLVFAGSFVALGCIVVIRLATNLTRPIDWVILILMLVVGLAAFLHRTAVSVFESARRAEAESFTRILSGLSRSVSPDAILSAIVDELARATDADHIVVVRRRPDARVLDATLTSARPGVHDSSTLLPIADLEDPVFQVGPVEREPMIVPVMASASQPVAAGPDTHSRLDALIGRGGRARVDLAGRLSGSAGRGGRGGRQALPLSGGREGQFVADRIAARVRRVYGLGRTLAVPLTSDEGVVGAIVLSHRTVDTWSATTRRLLAGAADEASAALARAYSHQDAEARASTDALTGLPNRRYFDEFCSLLARRRRSGDAMGVLMVDIDRFKRLNDTYGHAIGDEVLRAVGGAIVSAVREDDVPARYGGEEFVVLLRNPAPEVALEVGERVRAAVGLLDLERFGVDKVSVSVGVAVSDQTEQPIGELIVMADQALYRAKKGGRDRVVVA
jgi:diguanylate cyclase (GGDEF)-like protein